MNWEQRRPDEFDWHVYRSADRLYSNPECYDIKLSLSVKLKGKKMDFILKMGDKELASEKDIPFMPYLPSIKKGFMAVLTRECREYSREEWWECTLSKIEKIVIRQHNYNKILIKILDKITGFENKGNIISCMNIDILSCDMYRGNGSEYHLSEQLHIYKNVYNSNNSSDERFEKLRQKYLRLRYPNNCGNQLDAGLEDPTRSTSNDEAEKNLAEKDFGLNQDRRPLEYIANDYEDNGNGTITDHATGLMWQQTGPDNDMKYKEALKYTYILNRNRFAGHSDWRLPTIPELMSLLEPEEQSNDLHIATIFNDYKRWCWSADKLLSDSAYIVGFCFNYSVFWTLLDDSSWVRVVRSRS